MALGREAEAALAKFERRRTGRRYGLEQAKRRFNVVVDSRRLGVSGICDLVLEIPPIVVAWPNFPEKLEGLAPIELQRSRRLFPVEVKRTEGGVARHHTVQLAGYAMLLEEQEGLPLGAVDTGFLYLLPAERVISVRISVELRAAFEESLTEIRSMLHRERFPAPTRHRGFCPQCEYVNFCGDVL